MVKDVEMCLPSCGVCCKAISIKIVLCCGLTVVAFLCLMMFQPFFPNYTKSDKMPSLYYLNTPPNPFWDFVAGLEDHPFFGQHQGPAQPQPAGLGAEQTQENTTAAPAASASETTKGKQPQDNPEDPPEVDPSTVRPGPNPSDERGVPYRGRGRFSKAFDDNEDDEKKEEGDEDRHPKRGCHGHRGAHGRGPWGQRGGPPFGPPPFMFGHNFPFGPRGPFGRPGAPGEDNEEHEHRGSRGGWRGYGRAAPAEGHEGNGHHGGLRGRGGPHRGRWGHGPHHHGPGSPRGGPWGRHGRESGFDLGSFLNKLGDRLGVDLSSAAEGLGVKAPRNAETDFEPRTDIFDAPSAYNIHLSLPGAKKSDVGVDWDGEHSVLRIAGVVHRPGVDEEMMSRLVVDGRKRETGVFEKSIRLGTSKDPASVDVGRITARMVDGVLVVHVPKVEKKYEKKEIHVAASSPESEAERPGDAYMNEKDLLFDAEEDKETPEVEDNSRHGPTPTVPIFPETGKGKQREAEEEARHRDDRSETVGFEHPNPTAETLPAYEVEETNESEESKEHAHPQ